MRQYISGLVATLLFTFCGTAHGGMWEDFSKLIVGDWTGYGAILAEDDGGPLKRGDEFKLQGTFRSVANGTAVRGDQVLIAGEESKRAYDATVTFGWNPFSKVIEVSAYWADGPVELIMLDKQNGDDFTGVYTIFLPTGKKETADILLKTNGKNEYAWVLTSGKDSGATVSTWQRLETSTKAEDYIGFWRDYLQGGWDITVVKGEEGGIGPSGSKGTWTCTPHPAGNSMIFTATQNGKPMYNAIAGYDPKSQAWKEVFFLPDGGNFVQYYQATTADLDPKAVGQVIKGRCEYILADGTIELADIGVKVLSRDKWQYFVVNRRINGEPQPDLLIENNRQK